MAFYYIRNNGVFIGNAVGDGGRETVERVGAWDADVSKSYPSVKSLFADKATTGNTPIDSGDVVFVANDHVEDYGVGVHMTLGVETLSDYGELIIISASIVDYSLLKGANIKSGTLYIGSYNSRNNYYQMIGFVFDASTGSVRSNSRDSLSQLLDCTLNEGNYHYFGLGILTDCIVNSDYLRSSGTNYHNCKLSTLNSAYAWRDTSLNEYYGCDLTGLANTRVYGSSRGLRFYRCKMPDLMRYTSPPTFATNSPYVQAIGCDSGNGYFKSYSFDFFHDITTLDSLYLHYKYDGITGACIRIESTSRVNKSTNKRIKLCEIPAQDLAATDKTYRVQLLLDTDTVATLTTSDFWVELSHNDNTDLALGKVVSSRNSDILAAGVELTTSAETWQGTLPTNTKAYHVDIILNAASLPNVTNGNVEIYVNLAVPNADVYVCAAVQIGV
jgi:hypothetical protein